MNDLKDTGRLTGGIHRFIFEHMCVEKLSGTLIAQHTADGLYFKPLLAGQFGIVHLQIDEGIFTRGMRNSDRATITITQREPNLILTCDCGSATESMCHHEAELLTTIWLDSNLSIFFRKDRRQQQLIEAAKAYGLEGESDLDSYFDITLHNNQVAIAPRDTSMLAITGSSLQDLGKQLGLQQVAPSQKAADNTQKHRLIVLHHTKYDRQPQVTLMEAATTKDGSLKNPVTPLSPLDFLWDSEDPNLLKFFAGIHQMQQHKDGRVNSKDINALRAIVKNPAGHNVYYHDAQTADKITAAALVPTLLRPFRGQVIIDISREHDRYQIRGGVENNGTVFPFNDVTLRYGYFLDLKDALYLVEQPDLIRLIDFLIKRQNDITVHANKFQLFKQQIMDPLADKVIVNYKYIKPATRGQLKEQGFLQLERKLIYISESSHHIILTPTISYNDVEIPVRSKRQIYGQDNKGNDFVVARNEQEEVKFTALLLKQHPFFEEQLDNSFDHFYLHKERFLNEDWFLNAFEEWQQHDILVLGFNELEGNRKNPNKVKVNIQVLTGINWFNAVFKVYFGKQRAPLKSIQKSIRSKSKYVQLDDGTLGILPEAWIEKFSAYFNAGDINGDCLQIAKVNYSSIDALFDARELDGAVFEELMRYRQHWNTLGDADTITAPEGLLTTLRPYQLQGLNWLHKLDQLQFGGCLADDMGLGKTIQIIAFLLTQRSRAALNVNLLIVPATLVANWLSEIKKFAPSLKVLVVYGPQRVTDTSHFAGYEVILTSYGTLLSDIGHLKTFQFNYLMLDESQYIKNPQSQRYKAVRMLHARNRIAITGTPIENNTFDLYAQLSFACPGLLGSKQYFKDVYATPIDTFKVSKRARELQQKIQPFLLRRTKQQVAQELPPKTEMVLYCEMGTQQRDIYNAYEKEFREYISAATEEDLNRKQMNVLRGLTRLRQLCNAPALLHADALTTPVPSAKMEMLLQEIERQSPYHKILVFSQFVAMLDLIKPELERRGIGYSYLTGQTRNRQQAIEAFQEQEDVRVFLISLKAGGTGLNLTQADYVYLVDPWWNPAVENQAIDRVHRLGQESHVIAVRLICPNTVEDKIMKLQQSKRSLTDNLIKANGDTGFSLAKSDLLQMLDQ